MGENQNTAKRERKRNASQRLDTGSVIPRPARRLAGRRTSSASRRQTITAQRLPLARYRLLHGSTQQQRLFRNDDPRQNVRDDPGYKSATQGNEEPEDAHQRSVELKIVRQSGTNTADFAVGARAHQLLRNGRNPHQNAAVRAIARVISDNFAASIAIHDCPPVYDTTDAPGKFQRQLPAASLC